MIRVRDQVRFILAAFERATNSDEFLYEKFVERYYPIYYRKDSEGYFYIRFKDLSKNPKKETITRWRAF